MARTRRLGLTTTMVLQALHSEFRYGFDIMDATGLPSGVVYPALGRLEKDGLVRSHWEDATAAHEQGRPARRYYELTARGNVALDISLERLRAVQALATESGSGK